MSLFVEGNTMNRLNRVFTCVVVLACLCWVSAAPGKVIYVDDDAAGVDYGGSANNGSSWDHAFIYLQQALLAAQAGDEIRVAHGLYRPDQGLPPSLVPSRSGHTTSVVSMEGWTGATFSLKNGVTLLGGFAGRSAEDPNARDVQRHRTILSGDLRGNDIDIWMPGYPLFESLLADNSWHVVESISVDATAVLDGFIIESAVDTGLYNRSGSPQIANCLFQGNTAGNHHGGGLRCEGGHPTLSNCRFQSNRAAYMTGGAIHVTTAQLTLSDCRFAGNWARSQGGALCAVDSELALTRCTFEDNVAQEGGAIHQTAGTLTLTECTFETNLADNGGAVACAMEAGSMTRCVFRRNSATMYGGAVENAEVPLALEGCVFSGNTAQEGGALYAFRLTAPQKVSPCVITLTHCLLTGNRASDAGALCSNHVAFTILGCTFADNQASTCHSLGWMALREGEVPYPLHLENCIVWDGPGSIAQSASSGRRPPGITYSKETPDVVVRYCDVQAGWPGEGNIDADPCFAAPGHWVDGGNPKIIVDASHPNAAWVEGDYHLKSQAGRWDPPSQSWVLDDVTSPCIDAGDPNSPVGDEPEPNGGRVNLGAYGGTGEAGKSGPEKL
jgi:predicted outer membrane repeat protein